MLVAFAYSVLRLLLDVVDVRLRVRDPEAELLLLRHQLRVVRRQVKRPKLDLADRTIMAALGRVVRRSALVGMLVQPETVPRLASRAGAPEVGCLRSSARTWETRSGSRPSETDSADGKGKPEVGLRPSPRRVAQARSCGLCDGDSQAIASEPYRACPAEIPTHLEGFPASPSLRDSTHRFPERRHCAFEASLRPLIYGSGHEEGDLVRCHR